MDQNQTVDNDLQKAIDDITNNTNSDPVFSDPVAAPSSVPEGDTGELGDPIGPFMTVPEVPAPTAPTIPNPENPMPEPANAPVPPVPPVPPIENFNTSPEMNITNLPPEPNSFAPAPEPLPVPNFNPAPNPIETTPNLNLNIHQVKEAALRDLVPLLDKLNMSPSQRFNICRNIFEDLRDYSVLDQAYRAASAITDDTERAEALLYIVESIDKL